MGIQPELVDHRLDVNDEDWQLAGVIVDTSHRVRQDVETTLDEAQQTKERSATERHLRREIAVDDTKERRALHSAVRSAANVVRRHHEAGTHCDPAGCTRSCMTRAIGGKFRALVSVDDVIAEAELLRIVEPRDERWFPGKATPA
jgi:hypothetical protein